MKEKTAVKAIYAFSGDPITNGHVDIIRRAYKYFPNLVVGIGVNPDKKYTFSLEERIDMAKHCVSDLPGVEVVSYQGLLIDYAYENNIEVIIRGIRNSQDFEYEYNFYSTCKTQGGNCETFPIFTNPMLSHISSSVVKACVKEQGNVESFVHLYVKQKLEERILGQCILSITGSIGCGKSYVSSKLVELGKQNNIPVHNIDLDKISHEILSTLSEEQYVKIRREIAEYFKVNYNQDVQNEDGSINRKAVGAIVFSDIKAKKFLDKIMEPALKMRMRKEMYGKKGLILINAALIIESDLLGFSNNNVIIVTADKEIQKQRLKKRNYSDEQISHRVKSQLTNEEKLEMAYEKIYSDGHGAVFLLDTTAEKDEDIASIFNGLVYTFKIQKNESN